ncbi:MAG: replicative DNA helicase [Candidatus Xenolissoclinum pacificiensis L6]|uniref:Replicative DNA helicase n=1 Tax=Candidatus Xenolissoclinum pacificiensis L6 TaxID=1401685 RepID=W2UZR7_9RICK|nr:MAG: replicative DNA helicase [Candidatus Xenolissoclinum pacificiensis L6]
MEEITLPYSEEIEKYVLSALLADNDVFGKIEDILIHKGVFFFEQHQVIFSSMLNFFKKERVVTVQTLSQVLDQEYFVSYGNAEQYLLSLEKSFIGFIKIEEHARYLAELYLKREIVKLAQDMVFLSDISKGNSVQDIIENVEQKLSAISQTSVKESCASIKEVMEVSIDSLKHRKSEVVSGVVTGFTELNNLTGGFQTSDLIVVAGRPSMGKTALVVNQSLYVAEDFKKSENGKSVLFFSLEMSAEQIANRMLSIKAQVNSFRMRTGKLSKEEQINVLKVSGELSELPLFIDDTPNLSIFQVRSKIRHQCMKNNVGIVFIDYLQLLNSNHSKRYDSRVQEVSEITKGLKQIAKEINIPIVALSQLSRSVEQREDKKPQLSDLRESGSIEQDADLVMFIYREAYYLMRTQPKAGTEAHDIWVKKMSDIDKKSEIIIAKQRNGPIGSVNLFFDSNSTLFRDLDSQHIEESV